MIKLIFLLCTFGLYSYEVSIATVFRDEAPFLKEWIEFHKLIGVEHFYLYNNNSQDHFREVLSPYITQGIVELFDWCEEPTSREHWRLIQQGAMLDAVLRTRNVSKWVAFIDADEFIFPVKDKTLPNFLKKYEENAAVSVNWQNFGTSHVKQLKKDQLMIEQLILRAKTSFKRNFFVKSIVQVNFVDTERDLIHWDAHTLPLIPGANLVNANKQILHERQDPTLPIDKIRLHHYAFRDEEFFQNVKLNRPNADASKTRELKEFAKASNQVKDTSLLIYKEELTKAVNCP